MSAPSDPGQHAQNIKRESYGGGVSKKMSKERHVPGHRTFKRRHVPSGDAAALNEDEFLMP